MALEPDPRHDESGALHLPEVVQAALADVDALTALLAMHTERDGSVPAERLRELAALRARADKLRATLEQSDAQARLGRDDLPGTG